MEKMMPKTEGGTFFDYYIKSLEKSADHIPDNIEITKSCPFCGAKREKIFLIEGERSLANRIGAKSSYCQCSGCNLQTPKINAEFSRKAANKKSIFYWEHRHDA